jgi:hypothetical protein
LAALGEGEQREADQARDGEDGQLDEQDPLRKPAPATVPSVRPPSLSGLPGHVAALLTDLADRTEQDDITIFIFPRPGSIRTTRGPMGRGTGAPMLPGRGPDVARLCRCGERTAPVTPGQACASRKLD